MDEMGLWCSLFGCRMKEVRFGPYQSKVLCVRCGKVKMGKEWDQTQ